MSEFDSVSREELAEIILEQRGVIVEERLIVAELQEEIRKLNAEIEKLRSGLAGGGGAPHWVRANGPQPRKKERKKRQKWFVRRRESPTEIVEHALERCPDCGRKLSGGTVHHSRQVIEIPVMPVRVIEHRVIARYCGVCGKTHMPKLDLSEEVLGTHRVGVRLMSLVSYLHIVGRMPTRQAGEKTV